MSYLELGNIHKEFSRAGNQSVKVLDGINLQVSKGEFIAIFGPNGSGKTTLLNLIAGLIESDQGVIKIGGKDPSDSRIGFVFQNYSESLFPWFKNIENINFSLDHNIGSKKERYEYIKDYVFEMGLEELPLDSYPYQCSAGQQQLVALVRELIYKPDVLLMDEPFVSLDYDRRISQQQYLLKSWEKTKTTIVFVSHELDEAIFLADKLILLSKRPVKELFIYDISLQRPREFKLLETEEFFKIKSPILRKFRKIIEQ